MKTCAHPDCGLPKGECARDCLLYQMHRACDTTPIDYALPDDSRLTAARWAFKTHRALGLRVAIRKAWGAFWRKA